MVAAGTVRDDLTALKLSYDWAQREHGVVSPVELIEVPAGPARRPVSSIAAMPRGGRRRDVKWFDPAGYARYRDVGLLGLARDGCDDPTWRGRNDQRDGGFADGLYGTGLRLTEFASLLLVELPRDNPDHGFFTCTLAAATAKGGCSRKY